MFGTLILDLHRTEEGRLRRFFQRRLRDPFAVADATQETFLRLLSAAPRTPIANPQAYLFRMASNIGIDWERASRRRARVECPILDEDVVRNVPSDAASPEAALIDIERLRIFEAALLDLPERARTILLLSRREGWSYPDIARHLSISANTVYNDIRLAMGHCLHAVSRLDRV